MTRDDTVLCAAVRCSSPLIPSPVVSDMTKYGISGFVCCSCQPADPVMRCANCWQASVSMDVADAVAPFRDTVLPAASSLLSTPPHESARYAAYLPAVSDMLKLGHRSVLTDRQGQRTKPLVCASIPRSACDGLF